MTIPIACKPMVLEKGRLVTLKSKGNVKAPRKVLSAVRDKSFANSVENEIPASDAFVAAALDRDEKVSERTADKMNESMDHTFSSTAPSDSDEEGLESEADPAPSGVEENMNVGACV